MPTKHLLLSHIPTLTTSFLMLLLPFVTALILWHPRPADQTLLYSGLTNEILISPPLLL